jgi:hypothetical protein
VVLSVRTLADVSVVLSVRSPVDGWVMPSVRTLLNVGVYCTVVWSSRSNRTYQTIYRKDVSYLISIFYDMLNHIHICINVLFPFGIGIPKQLIPPLLFYLSMPSLASVRHVYVY